MTLRNPRTIRIPLGVLDVRVEVTRRGRVRLTAHDALGRPVKLTEPHLSTAWAVLASWGLSPDPEDRTKGRTAFDPEGWRELFAARADESMSATPLPV